MIYFVIFNIIELMKNLIFFRNRDEHEDFPFAKNLAS